VCYGLFHESESVRLCTGMPGNERQEMSYLVAISLPIVNDALFWL
jgi:hypothetical protein